MKDNAVKSTVANNIRRWGWWWIQFMHVKIEKGQSISYNVKNKGQIALRPGTFE
jgi:hypothetical protein